MYDRSFPKTSDFRILEMRFVFKFLRTSDLFGMPLKMFRTCSDIIGFSTEKKFKKFKKVKKAGIQKCNFYT